MTGHRVAMLMLCCACQPLLLCQTRPSNALDVFLIVDNSRSMRRNDSNFAITGALASFADRLPPDSQLGILIFDKDAKVVLELTRTTSGKFRSDVGAGLRKLSYKGSRSDLAGAVERAIYELRQQGRSNASRAIVLVTSGVLNVGTKSATAARGRWLREDLGVEAKKIGVSIFPVTVNQGADYQLALALARTTGGEYYRALEPALLPPALAQVNERLTKMVDTAEVGPASPANAGSPPASVPRRRLILWSAIVIGLAVLVLALMFARQRPGHPKVPAPAVLGSAMEEAPQTPSLSFLREHGTAVSRELANVTELLAQANSKVNQFQTAVERYALSNYKVLQDADEQCFTLARECILMLDHLDIMIRRAEENDEPASSLRDARRRLRSLLETANIEEIPVNAGDIFDGAVQVPTSVVWSSGPEGVVIEVSRKGYAMKVGGRSDVMLRAAEVTVSARHLETKPGHGGAA